MNSVEPEAVFQEALSRFCGHKLARIVAERGKAALTLGGERQRGILSYMQVATSAIQDFTSRMATHVAAFDACYEATAESGEIFDFEFDRALMWHPDPPTDCIDWAAALVSALAERVSDEVSFCVSLHAGEPMVANWGATHRFRRMLLGPDVEYARMAASEGLKNGTTTVITESPKNAGLEGQIEPIGVYGIVGAGTTRLYRVV